jgi:hypothetical protein
MDNFDDYLDQDIEFCDVCGAELIDGYPEEGGCPFCLPCGGEYAPGTEECMFCKWSDECARLARWNTAIRYAARAHGG